MPYGLLKIVETMTRPLSKKRITDAIIIKPAEGKSYAEVQLGLRTSVKAEEMPASILRVWKTAKGDILVPSLPNGRGEGFSR